MKSPPARAWASAVRRYALALPAVGLAVAFCVALQPALGLQVPHLVFLAAALVVALFGGFGPGALAVVLGAAAIFGLLPVDRSSWLQRSSADVLGVVLYLAVGWVGIAICEAHRRSKVLAERNLALATERAAELEMEAERRLRAQDEAREAADGTQRILQSVGDGVMAFDLDWTILFANDNALSILGKMREDVVGQNLWVTFPDLAGTPFEKQVREAMAAGMPRQFESHNPASGTCWENRTYPTATGITLFSRDVTEQHRVEQALQESRRFVEKAAAAMPSVLYVYDLAQDRNVYANRELAMMLGYPSERVSELAHGSWAELLHPDDYQELSKQRQGLGTGSDGQVAEREFRVKDVDGEWRWFSSREIPFQRRPGGAVSQILGVAHDITDRKRAEQSLEQSDERYRAFITQSSEAIWRFELREPVPTSLPPEEQVELLYQHAYLAECNDQMARIRGFERADQIIGAPLDQIRPRAHTGTVEYLAGLAANGYRADGAEFQELDDEGNPRWFLRNVVGIIEDGKLLRTWGTERDITERKAAESNLRDALQKLDFHVANSPLAMLEWDSDIRITRWSPNAERMFGWKAEEVLGKTLAEMNLVHSTEAPRIHRLLANVKAGGVPGAAVTARLQCRDGENVWCEWYCSALRDDRGNLSSVMCLLHDITAQRRAVEAVHESEARLRIALEAAQMASWEWVEGSDSLMVSDHICDLFDIPAGEDVTLGRLLEAIHPMDRERVRRGVAGAVANNADYRYEFRVVRRDGSVRWIAVSGRAIHGAAGEDRRFAGVVHDVTEKLRQDQEIRQLNADLEQRVTQRTKELQHANEELESFCYSVSHDLRGPLRSIIGAGMILREDYGSRLEPDAADNLQRIVNAARRMAQLIDDLLQLSRLARMDVTRQPLDLAEIARDVEAELRSRGAQAEVVIQPELTSIGDSRLVRVALINLMENAVKFSAKNPSPKVEVGSMRTAGGEVLYVRDNGIGFDSQYGEKIFEPFQRLHRDSEYPGTGIGLANVKRIIERHGGRIWVESAEGEGATFYFTL